MQEFIQLIKGQLTYKNMTVMRLSEKVGLSKSYVYALIEGRKRFNQDVMQSIATELDITIEFKAS